MWIVLAKIIKLPMVTMAVLNGHTYAGGVFFALSHDFRTMVSTSANPKARFCINEAKMGLPYPIPAIKLCSNTLGPVENRLLSTGIAINSDKAFEIGAV
jgi:enoyl-CoA hydratase/carnithine racemase